jgi:hypothetical protein
MKYEYAKFAIKCPVGLYAHQYIIMVEYYSTHRVVNKTGIEE